MDMMKLLALFKKFGAPTFFFCKMPDLGKPLVVIEASTTVDDCPAGADYILIGFRVRQAE